MCRVGFVGQMVSDLGLDPDLDSMLGLELQVMMGHYEATRCRSAMFMNADVICEDFHCSRRLVVLRF